MCPRGMYSTSPGQSVISEYRRRASNSTMVGLRF